MCLSIILRGGDSCLTVRVQEEHSYYKTQKEKKKTQFTTCHVKVGGEVKAQFEVVLRDKLVFQGTEGKDGSKTTGGFRTLGWGIQP